MHQRNQQAQVHVLPMGHTIHHATALCPAALVWRTDSQPERLTAAQHRPVWQLWQACSALQDEKPGWQGVLFGAYQSERKQLSGT